MPFLLHSSASLMNIKPLAFPGMVQTICTQVGIPKIYISRVQTSTCQLVAISTSHHCIYSQDLLKHKLKERVHVGCGHWLWSNCSIVSRNRRVSILFHPSLSSFPHSGHRLRLVHWPLSLNCDHPAVYRTMQPGAPCAHAHPLVKCKQGRDIPWQLCYKHNLLQVSSNTLRASAKRAINRGHGTETEGKFD